MFDPRSPHEENGFATQIPITSRFRNKNYVLLLDNAGARNKHTAKLSTLIKFLLIKCRARIDNAASCIAKEDKKKCAQPGNRTPVSTVGGYYDTTTPAAR